MSKKKTKQMLVIELRTLKENVPQNPVAKFAHHVNKAGFFRDRTVYSRKGKHKDRESFHIRYSVIMNTKEFVGSSLIHFTQRTYFGSKHSS
jgi:hypothetical protein